MATTRTQKAILWGTVGVLGLVAATVFVLLHKNADQLNLASGKRALAKHLATPIDLTRYYATPASIFDPATGSSYWKAVPSGFQVFNNVPLQIDGMMYLWGEGNANKGAVFPEQIPGIAVNRKFETLYVYHAAFFSSPNRTPVYEMVFRYEDGSSVTNQLLYGSDLLDFNSKGGKTIVGPNGPHSKLAWVGGSFTPDGKQPLRFCLTAIDNPQPSLVVTSMDLFSCRSRSAACILAMTTGRSGLMK
jgi:hypothetical protein